MSVVSKPGNGFCEHFCTWKGLAKAGLYQGVSGELESKPGCAQSTPSGSRLGEAVSGVGQTWEGGMCVEK